MQSNQQPSFTGTDGRTQGEYAPMFSGPYPLSTYCQPSRPKTMGLMPNPDIGRVNVWARVHRRRVMARVMSQPELLEMVFLHLDLQSLMLSVSRVCKVWKEVLCSPQMERLIQQQTDELHWQRALVKQYEQEMESSNCTPCLPDEDDDL